MPNIKLGVDPKGVETGVAQAERHLDGLKRKAGEVEDALDNMSSRGGDGLDNVAAKADAADVAQRNMAGGTDGLSGSMDRLAAKLGQNNELLSGLIFEMQNAETGASKTDLSVGKLVASFGLADIAGRYLGEGLKWVGVQIFNLDHNLETVSDSVGGFEGDVADLSAKVKEQIDLVESWRQGLDRVSSMDLKVGDTGLLIAQARAIRSSRDAVLELQDALDASIASKLVGMAFLGDVTAADAALIKLQATFDLTEQDAVDFYTTLMTLDESSTPTQQIEAYSQLREMIISSAGGIENLDSKALGFVETLYEGEVAARALVDASVEMEPVFALAADAADGIGTALDSAQGFADGLISKAGTLTSEFMKAAAAIAEATMNAARTNYIEGLGTSSGRGNVNISPEQVAALKAGGGTYRAEPTDDNPRRGGGGGGSQASEVDKTKEAYDRLIGSLDETIRAEQQLNEGQLTVNEALAAGIINAADAENAMSLLQARYNESADTMEGAAARIQRTLSKALSPTANLEKAASGLMGAFEEFFLNPAEVGLDGLLVSIAGVFKQIAAKALASKLVSSLLGGGGGIFAGLFDSGGQIPSGSYGVVAENRPELVDGTLMTKPAVVKGPANVTGGADTAALLNSGGSGGKSAPSIYNFWDLDDMMEHMAKSGDEVVMNILRRNGVV